MDVSILFRKVAAWQHGIGSLAANNKNKNRSSCIKNQL